MTNETKNVDNKRVDDRLKVFVRSLNKIATVHRSEHDSVWGIQHFVSTFSREWGPDYFWVKAYEVDELVSKQNNKRE